MTHPHWHTQIVVVLRAILKRLGTVGATESALERRLARAGSVSEIEQIQRDWPQSNGRSW